MQDPAFRIEVSFAGETVPWISDGVRSTIREPHVHAGALLLTDPRGELLLCARPNVLGSMDLLGRDTTGVGCRTEGTLAEYRIDDATGMILMGRDQGGSAWEFVELKFDPVFPTGTFEIPDESA